MKPFKKGFDERRNLKGRPKNPWVQKLYDAVEKAGKTKGQDFIEYMALLAYMDKGVAVEIMKKLIPSPDKLELSEDTLDAMKKVLFGFGVKPTNETDKGHNDTSPK